MIEVVTVYSPRPNHPKWCDYLTGMAVQRRTAEKFGCRHMVVTDESLPGFAVLPVVLPESLMHAILVGQIAYLEQWNVRGHIVCDAVCGIDQQRHLLFVAAILRFEV